ncbi:MAG: hypothetical protein ABSB41_00020 [Anaerolineales bacterium]|jgi:uncharacterized membrane protein
MAEQNPEEAILQAQAVSQARLRRQRWILAGIIAGVIVVLALVAGAVYGLLQNPGTTANIRDIFIIFMAFESLIIGVALVILVIQIASLINLLQNEVKPILAATNETVNTLRGTTEFLSENLVEPVIKLNSTVAGLRRIFEIFGLMK